ncbi:hypothetical protein VM95_33445 [Streptomyces rubellomurinus]|uniref:Uncharacterized protein n=1 Tax=Streptomyces rubellomurinus (strain ATCC 31215) TaxID=359131 RepID=A0A0F2T7M3_STRR3|nr:hypothetical protein VM95_33445 [Streptomyces rubellomurinus]
MPKNRSTAAQRARQRQAATGEKYTTALRAQRPCTTHHQIFSARGAGWTPITQRAEQRFDHAWPGHPRPHWEEKFGELCWKSFPWQDAPAEAHRILREAQREADATCQSCPAPGRKRVVWIWDDYCGTWIMPWVKTCCDNCYWVPSHLLHDGEYRFLFETYEESSA